MFCMPKPKDKTGPEDHLRFWSGGSMVDRPELQADDATYAQLSFFNFRRSINCWPT